MNSEEQIKDLYTKHQASAEKYDYFMCTVAGGLFAYIGQQFSPEKVSRPAATTTFFALGCLAFFFYIGCKRIQVQNSITRTNQSIIECEDVIQKTTRTLDEGKHHKLSGKSMELRDDLGRHCTIGDLENIQKVKFEERVRLCKLFNCDLDLVEKYGKLGDKFLIAGFFFIVLAKIFQWIN